MWRVQCKGKQSYETFSDTERAMKRKIRRGAFEGRAESAEGKVRPYRCPYCRKYHLGHTMQRKKPRMLEEALSDGD